MFTSALLDANYKTEPWHHQLVEFDLGVELPARALLWQMRTGKTKQIVDTASHLYRRDLIDAVIIFAPNGVHENWTRREVPLHGWDDINHITLPWRTAICSASAGNRMSKADYLVWEDAHRSWWDAFAQVKKQHQHRQGLVWMTFNTESMIREDVRKVIAGLLRKHRCLVVWDESSDFRTPGSSRSLMSRALARRAPFRRILDGTVVTNSPLHAFSQYELLEKAALGFGKYEDFKDRYAIYEKQRRGRREVPILVDYQNLDELRARMAPYSSVVLRGDCNDLPDVVPRTRHVVLSPQQERAYQELHERTTIEIGNDEVSLGERINRVMKFQQIVSGFVIDENKVTHTIPGGNPRLDALADEVYLASGKVLIFCLFQEEIDNVKHRLMVDGWDVVEYHGRVSGEDKLRALDRFTNDGAVKALIGQYQSISRGLELSAAGTILCYSHTFNAIHRQQGIERATKMMGTNVDLVDFMAPGVDGYVLRSTSDKVATADLVAGKGMQDILKEIALR